MDCLKLFYSGHALRRMFERNIGDDAVRKTIQSGQVVAEYLDDKPYPTFLILGFVEENPLHVVIARDPVEQTCMVVTAYQPSLAVWHRDFKTRK